MIKDQNKQIEKDSQMDKGFQFWEKTGQIKRLSKTEAKKTVEEYLELERWNDKIYLDKNTNGK